MEDTDSKDPQLEYTEAALSSSNTLREELIKKTTTPGVDKFEFTTPYCELSFNLEKVYTKEGQRRRLKIYHLWLHELIRGEGYGTVIKETVESIAREEQNVKEIIINIQNSEGYEDSIFREWGYNVVGPYNSEYENDVIEATKDITE